MNGRTDYLPLSSLFFCVLGLIPSVLAYNYVASLLIPAEVHYDLGTLFEGGFSNWRGVADSVRQAWSDLIQARHGFYLTLSVLAAVLTGGGWVALIRRRPTSLAYAAAGWLTGGVAGFLLAQLVELPASLDTMAMPLLAFLGGWLVALFTAPSRPEAEVAIVRGTRIVPYTMDTRKAVADAVRKERVCLAGFVLPVKAEVRSILLLGASGTGKTVAIEAMMHTILARGNRMIVADPDGTAMSKLWKAGDTILNPFDGRSVRWDILAEIRKPTDFKHLSESILPYTGDAKTDEWRRFAQEVFAACLRTWFKEELGTSDKFFTTMARSSQQKLGLLCQGTSAAKYFAEGGEKTLANIMITLTPALEELEMLVGSQGEPFSVRKWMREGKGTLWIPYQADQIAALRGPVSCWMRLAIFELLSMRSSQTRRMWFFLDELDALGRIQGLKDALVRARKKGGCIVGGIQSIAQVRAVYGDAEAQTIVEQFKTQLALSCGTSEGGGTARLVSTLIGEREVERIETSTSYNRGQDGVSTTTSYRRQVEQAVLPSEIMQLPDLSGYLRVSGQAVWMKIAFEPIELEEHTSPAEPVAQAELVQPSSPIPVPQPPPAAAAPAIDPQTGYPVMSFPFSPERAFNLTAEFYGAEHPQRPPAPQLEGDYSLLAGQQKAYERGWIDGVWADFRRWWLNAPEEERYHKVMAALKRAGLELAGFDAIPDAIWEELKALRPAEGKTPFLGLRWAAQV